MKAKTFSGQTIFEGILADRKRKRASANAAWAARNRMMTGVPFLCRIEDFDSYEEYAKTLLTYRKAVSLGGRKFAEASTKDGSVFGLRGIVKP